MSSILLLLDAVKIVSPLTIRFILSDFCAGGDGVGSPVGTIRAALAENGYYNTSIPYQALDYYGSVSADQTNPESILSISLSLKYSFRFVHKTGLFGHGPVRIFG